VVLHGPRQAGKTTLAHAAAQPRDALYLDLESERDRARLAEPELYLAEHLGRLVVLDEVHRAPGLFPLLRGLIDRGRRAGRRSGMYLLLGSAALELLRQSGETLAGRVSYLTLDPFDVLEAATRSPRWIGSGCGVAFPRAFSPPTTPAACADGRTSSRPTWNATSRSSARASPPIACAACGPCSPTTRAAY
jgi:hypothetical protein